MGNPTAGVLLAVKLPPAQGYGAEREEAKHLGGAVHGAVHGGDGREVDHLGSTTSILATTSANHL
jgi:hypothetical protein